MFSVSDIKEDVYPAVYRRGKELYETGGVLDFAYDIYLEHDLPVAEVRAEVRGREQGSYRVTVIVDEEYGSVSSSNCTCEAFMRGCANTVSQRFLPTSTADRRRTFWLRSAPDMRWESREAPRRRSLPPRCRRRERSRRF